MTECHWAKITHLHIVTELTGLFERSDLYPVLHQVNAHALTKTMYQIIPFCPNIQCINWRIGWMNVSGSFVSPLCGNDEIDAKFILKFSFVRGLISVFRVHVKDFPMEQWVFSVWPHKARHLRVLDDPNDLPGCLTYIYIYSNRWQLNRPITFHCNCSTSFNGLAQMSVRKQEWCYTPIVSIKKLCAHTGGKVSRCTLNVIAVSRGRKDASRHLTEEIFLMNTALSASSLKITIRTHFTRSEAVISCG